MKTYQFSYSFSVWYFLFHLVSVYLLFSCLSLKLTVLNQAVREQAEIESSSKRSRHTEEKESSTTTSSDQSSSSSQPILKAHVVLPSKAEIEKALLEKKKRELLAKYAQKPTSS
jgi:hypothetical protein